MSEDQELSRLEQKWKSRFDRYTSPEPAAEQTLRLIEGIKRSAEGKPADLRAELEAAQSAESALSRLAGLFLSQWNLYGLKSWLPTGLVMLAVTVAVTAGAQNEMDGIHAWMKWISLAAVAAMGLAFRPANDGNDVLEKLSCYPLIQQMFARYVIVTVLQVVLSLFLSLLILGDEVSIPYLLGSFVPVIFFGAVGFTSAMWFGPKAGVLMTLLVWFGQLLLDQRHHALSVFRLPWSGQWWGVTAGIAALCCLMLGSVMLRFRLKRDLK